MTWLTWRQHRATIIATGVALALVSLLLLPTGLSMHSSFQDTGLRTCLAHDRANCAALSNAWLNQYALTFLIPLFLVVPGLLGLFWGAPMVAREIEQGTQRLAWTQTVTRTRWLVIKAVALGAGVVIAAGLLQVFLTWWSGPLVAAANDGFDPGVFDLLGVVPLAYALFAFALGVAAGTLLRRTLAAMGVTLATYISVRLGIGVLLRQYYLPAKTASYPLDARTPTALDGAWQTAARTVDSAGNLVSRTVGIDFGLIRQRCPNLADPARNAVPDQAALQACIHNAGIHVVASYQPADRYWLFQGIESAIFVVFTVALVALSIWWVRRHPS